MERMKFLQIIKAILGRSLPVLNFSYHLPKPWTDRFAYVNNKQPFIFYSYPSNKVEKQKSLSEDRLLSFTSSHMKERKFNFGQKQKASGSFRKNEKIVPICYDCSPYSFLYFPILSWERTRRDVFFKLSFLWHFLKLFYFHFEMVFTPKSDLIKKS